jgi:endonuclease YncB( thermonuclease family)
MIRGLVFALASVAHFVGAHGSAFAQDAARAEPSRARVAFTARVTGVADGDTVTVIDRESVRHRIRIAGIDAPESAQPFGDASRTELAALIRGRQLEVVPIKRDPFGRLVANLSVDGTDVGLAMVQAGLAWHFVRYAADQTPDERGGYAQAERSARAAGIGLWQDAAPTAPWAWREQIRRAARPQAEGR